jgi:hypothetical protein
MPLFSKKKLSPAPANKPASRSQATQSQQSICTCSAHALRIDPRSGPSSSPFPRYYFTLSTIATAAGELFLFGGNTYDRKRNDVYVISTRDFSTTLLRTSGDVPKPLTAHCAVFTGTTLFIWGGRLDFSDQVMQNQTHDDSLYLLNLSTSDLLLS